MSESAYFHRELPYETGRAERHNPRLRAARALVEAGSVRFDGDEPATVTVDGRVHRVRSAEGRLTCTCQWWAEYRGGRGPCKHVLAVRIARPLTPADHPPEPR
ncbi:SWIM zinc finger domain-containing protein [Nocardiopsis sp. ARC36]